MLRFETGEKVENCGPSGEECGAAEMIQGNEPGTFNGGTGSRIAGGAVDPVEVGGVVVCGSDGGTVVDGESVVDVVEDGGTVVDGESVVDVVEGAVVISTAGVATATTIAMTEPASTSLPAGGV